MASSSLLFFIIVAFLAYRNAIRAKLKDKSAGLYAFLTALLFIAFEMVGMAFIVLFFCRDEINLALLADSKNQPELIRQMNMAFDSNTLRPLTMDLFGFGGYLVVRYIIDSFPEKKKNIPLWPDNENAV